MIVYAFFAAGSIVAATRRDALRPDKLSQQQIEQPRNTLGWQSDNPI